MKNILLIAGIISLFSYQSFACIGPGDEENFDNRNSTNGSDFYSFQDPNYGEFTISNSESHSGSKSMKVQVDKFAQFQMAWFHTANCLFNINSDELFIISFYAKGTPNNKIEINLENQTDPNIDKVTSSIELTSDWTLYTVQLKATFTTTKGRIRLRFRDVGEYYIDDYGINTYDCHGDKGGTASLDACDICSGGNTGTPITSVCTKQDVAPNNPNIIFEGVAESETTSSKTTFYRFIKNYALNLNGDYGNNGRFYTNKASSATAGVVIRLKTASPNVVLHLSENLTYQTANPNKETAIYMNDTLLKHTAESIISVSNSTGSSVEWKFILPAKVWYELNKIETVVGYDLEQIIVLPKPRYVSIGNSITQGVGTSNGRSSTAYTRLVAENYGYELYNWAVSGSVVLDKVTDNFEITGIEPALVTVLWGYNDTHAPRELGDDWYRINTFPKYTALIDYLCDELPKTTKIMAILPTFTTNPYASSVRNIDTLRVNQENIILARQPTCPNLKYMNGWDYTSASDLADDVHLNDNGNKSLADGIIFECDKTITATNNTVNVNDKFSTYPNPTNGIVNLPTQLKYTVTNLSNQEVLTGEGSVIDLSTLEKGIYFIITDLGKSKVVKQ